MYGRAQAPRHDASRKGDGPVYVVSIAGPKQYRVSAAAQALMTRSAEDTQLYQIVRVSNDVLSYESWTVAGQLYDAFDLRKNARGVTRLIDRPVQTPQRRCPHERSPGGRTDRCWDGTEW